MIRLQKVTLYKHNKLYFNNVSIQFKEGFCYGIIGKNGSGKSLLCQTIAGLMKPVQGQVVTSKELRYGIVTSENNYYHFSTVYEYLFHFYVNEIHMALHLSHNFGIPLHIPANELSGSQKLLLEIIVAMHPENDLILLDCSWTHLDFYLKQRLIEAIKNFGLNRTLIAFSVNQADLDEYCRYIYEIENFGLIPKKSIHEEVLANI